jgi:hypothetical protein
MDGAADGAAEGTAEGAVEGAVVGEAEGAALGTPEGAPDATAEYVPVGEMGGGIVGWAQSLEGSQRIHVDPSAEDPSSCDAQNV